MCRCRSASAAIPIRYRPTPKTHDNSPPLAVIRQILPSQWANWPERRPDPPQHRGPSTPAIPAPWPFVGAAGT